MNVQEKATISLARRFWRFGWSISNDHSFLHAHQIQSKYAPFEFVNIF